MKQLAIIGVDPGTTAGYVALGLDGTVIRSHSAKEFSMSRMISEVFEACHPLIVGTDKAKVPSFVELFARKVGAEVVAPEDDLKKREKRSILKEYYEQGYHSTHTQDSLAAALFALRKYRPRLHKIKRFIEQNGIEDSREFTRRALMEELHFKLLKEQVEG